MKHYVATLAFVALQIHCTAVMADCSSAVAAVSGALSESSLPSNSSYVSETRLTGDEVSQTARWRNGQWHRKTVPLHSIDYIETRYGDGAYYVTLYCANGADGQGDPACREIWSGETVSFSVLKVPFLSQADAQHAMEAIKNSIRMCR